MKQSYSTFLLYVFPITIISLPLSIVVAVIDSIKWHHVGTWISAPFIIWNFIKFLRELNGGR